MEDKNYIYKSIGEAYRGMYGPSHTKSTEGDTGITTQYSKRREGRMKKRGITAEEVCDVLSYLHDNAISQMEIQQLLESDKQFKPGEGVQDYLKRVYGHVQKGTPAHTKAMEKAKKLSEKRKKRSDDHEKRRVDRPSESDRMAKAHKISSRYGITKAD